LVNDSTIFPYALDSMSLPTSWQELILLFSAIQGVILSIALGSKLKSSSPANKVLILFILSLVFLLFSGSLPKNEWFKFVKLAMGYIGDTVAFLYGPLLYLYTRKLLLVKMERREWPHLVPAMIFFVINIVANSIGYSNLGATFNRVFWLVVSACAFTQLFAYLYLSVRTVLYYKRTVQQELSYKPYVDYLLTIIGFVTFSLLLFLANFISEVFGLSFDVKFIDYNVAWISISLLTFILGYYAIINPELFRVKPRSHSSNSSDSPEISKIKEDLTALMTDDQLYLDPELSLAAVASKLSARKEIVSRVINQEMSSSFYRFVNEYRVQEFKRLVGKENTKHITHLGLAFEAGFKSKTTFYKAFKDVTGGTPSEFLGKS
ncbi:MAG: helix-turn-helix domain-containing protein, partial [Cyclobacteriaceae bacterium]